MSNVKTQHRHIAKAVPLLATLRSAVMLLILLTLLCGLIYPMAVTLIARFAFPHQAQGSLIVEHSQVIGSDLIGQSFTGKGVFWSRPSATADQPYNGGNSAGSNLGPSNPALVAAVNQRITTLKTADPQNKKLIPMDLVTSSASGLDPHISVAAAEYQIDRVAREIGADKQHLQWLIKMHTEKPLFNFLGEPRVNVLRLNQALRHIPRVAPPLTLTMKNAHCV